MDSQMRLAPVPTACWASSSIAFKTGLYFWLLKLLNLHIVLWSAPATPTATSLTKPSLAESLSTTYHTLVPCLFRMIIIRTSTPSNLSVSKNVRIRSWAVLSTHCWEIFANSIEFLWSAVMKAVFVPSPSWAALMALAAKAAQYAESDPRCGVPKNIVHFMALRNSAYSTCRSFASIMA